MNAENRNQARFFPVILFALYMVEFAVLAIHPHNRVVWLSENIFSVTAAAVLTVLYAKGFRFSNLAYFFAWSWIVLHTVGGHYTFELVPFDWITDCFGFRRNHFDRVCHFLVGTFAFIVLEMIERTRLIRNRGFMVFAVIMGVFGFSAIFEIIEWLYAEFSDPTAGAAFLGSQGDVWDAQKDMLADGLGAIFASIVYLIVNRKNQSDSFVSQDSETGS